MDTNAYSGDVVETVLSYNDSFGLLSLVGSTITYIVDAAKPPTFTDEAVKSAAESVARRWRFWAGRAAFSTELNRWTIRVPTGSLPPSYPLIDFSSTTSAHAYPAPLPSTSKSTCTFLPALDRSSLEAKSTVVALADLEAGDGPLVAVRLASYADVQLLSFTVSHAFADGKSLGLYLCAFSNELNAVGWDAPEIETSSKIDEAILAVQTRERDNPASAPGLSVAPGGIGFGAQARSVMETVEIKAVNWMNEKWYGAEEGGVFLGRDVAEWLIGRVKRDVARESAGNDFVSSADILLAWLLKSIYANEPKHGQVKVTGTISLRPLFGLSEDVPLNTIANFLCPDHPSPHSSSLAQIALYNRRLLANARDPVKYAAYFAWQASFPPAEMPNVVTHGLDSYTVSVQIGTGMSDALDLGRGRGVGYTFRSAPAPGGVGVLLLNSFESGYMWTTKLRKSRWDSVRAELDKLQAEYEADRIV